MDFHILQSPIVAIDRTQLCHIRPLPVVSYFTTEARVRGSRDVTKEIANVICAERGEVPVSIADFIEAALKNDKSNS